MRSMFTAAVFFALLATGTAALAAATQMDGQLPMYPAGKLDPRETSLTPAAIAHGVPLVLLTQDPVTTVTGWYASEVPKSCARQDASGTTKFACPGGSIMIYAKSGQTQIALIPPLGLP
jgi:hypothetical protein